MSQSTLTRGACLPTADANFLKQINQGFSDAWWENYHELIRRREDCLLSEAELRELIQLTDQMEKREAKRLQALVKLAKLRKMPLRSLMKELGLPGGADA